MATSPRSIPSDVITLSHPLFLHTRSAATYPYFTLKLDRKQQRRKERKSRPKTSLHYLKPELLSQHLIPNQSTHRWPSLRVHSIFVCVPTCSSLLVNPKFTTAGAFTVVQERAQGGAKRGPSTNTVPLNYKPQSFSRCILCHIFWSFLFSVDFSGP